jgi:hypothetical protein
MIKKISLHVIILTLFFSTGIDIAIATNHSTLKDSNIESTK